MKVGNFSTDRVIEQCIDTIRILSADMVEKARSGHPGAPIALAPLGFVLFSEYLQFDASDPSWINRDRFVLSNGHACALQYSLLCLFECGLDLEDLKHFRQFGSRTPGHPELGITPGIEVSTGPLGQGVSNAVGMAIAQARLRAEFNRPDFPLIDNYVFCVVGDGCLQEGISYEALSLAGHLKLDRFVVFYDDNGIQIDGGTDLAFTENIGLRFESIGFRVIVLGLSHGLDDIRQAIDDAKTHDGPVMIRLQTVIGVGSEKQGTEKVHGSPLGTQDLARLKQHYGFDPNQYFVVPDQVREYCTHISKLKSKAVQKWTAMFSNYEKDHPELASELRRRCLGQLPKDWRSLLPQYNKTDPPMATRSLSGIVLDRIADQLPELVGGSADLTSSNLTRWKTAKDFQQHCHAGRYFRFGVREHGMAGICNGIAAYGGFLPFAATFLNFITYGWGAVRLSALSRHRMIYIMTHDSIGLGEDGPTHQPIETLAALRALPNMLVFRPADGNEVSGCYAVALEHPGPSVLCLTRQAVPHLGTTCVSSVACGAYAVMKSAAPDIILVGTGSEVSILVEAAHLLSNQHIETNVVSMPCWELFEDQSDSYRRQIFIPGIPVLSLEALSTFGWTKYAHVSLGLDSFGMSAPYQEIYKSCGFSPQNVAEQAVTTIGYYKTHPVPHLLDKPKRRAKD